MCVRVCVRACVCVCVCVRAYQLALLAGLLTDVGELPLQGALLLVQLIHRPLDPLPLGMQLLQSQALPGHLVLQLLWPERRREEGGVRTTRRVGDSGVGGNTRL